MSTPGLMVIAQNLRSVCSLWGKRVMIPIMKIINFIVKTARQHAACAQITKVRTTSNLLFKNRSIVEILGLFLMNSVTSGFASLYAHPLKTFILRRSVFVTCDRSTYKCKIKPCELNRASIKYYQILHIFNFIGTWMQRRVLEINVLKYTCIYC